MTQFKKFAKYGSAVVASLAVAVTLLLTGSPRVAHATVTAPIGTAPIMATGLTETWTVTYTESGTVGITTAALTFPSGFTVPQGTITGATALGGGACTGVTASGSGQVVSFTMTSCATAANGTNNLVVPGVTNPTTAGATAAGFKVTTSVDATGATGATVNIWNTTATKSPTTSVPADGASTVALTFTPSATTTNTGTTAFVITATTDVGTFPTTPTEAVDFFQAVTAITTPVTSATMSLAATIDAADTMSITLKAPSTAGTATVVLRATPATGGASVIIGSTQVVFTTAAALPGAAASVSVVPAATNVGFSTAQNTTITVRDAAGTFVLNGTTVTATTSNGTFSTCTGGTTGSGVCTTSVAANGAVTVGITGSSVSGTQTITATVGSVSGSATVTLTGNAATLELSGRRSNSATSFTAKSVVRNTDSSTTNQDELSIAAVAKDSAGGVIGSGSVTFTVTGPAGNTVVFSNAAEASGITITGTACATSGTGTTTCVDTIEAAATGASTPSHAVGYIDVDSLAGEPVGTYTVTATTTGANNATITGTMTFTLVKAPASLTVSDVSALGLGESKPITITCKDADGNACPSGTLVNVNVSNANLIAQTASTGTTGTALTDAATNDAGTTTVNLIGVTPGSTNIVVNVGTVTAVKAVTVGSTATTPPPAAGTGGTFSGGTIAPAGVSIVSFTGTTAQLNTSGAAAKAVSVTATVGGKMITFVVGAPDFVNAEFNAAFPTGLSGTLVIVKTGA